MCLYSIYCDLIDSILFGIFNSITMVACGHCLANIILYHWFYFYIMCHYLDIKMRRNNLDINKMKLKSH